MTHVIEVPFHIGDFLSGTMHMDGTEIGAYWMLCVAHYQEGLHGLDDNDRQLARIAKVTPKVWARIRPIIAKKFQIEGGRWTHKKVCDVLRKMSDKSAQNSAKSLKRWRTDNATALPQGSQPTTNNQEPNNTVVDSRARVHGYVVVGKEIAKITGWDRSPNWFGDYTRVDAWLRSGWDPDLDIYPTVKRLMATRDDPPKSLKYFEQAIADAYACRMSPLPKGTPNATHQRKPTKHERIQRAADEATAEILA